MKSRNNSVLDKFRQFGFYSTLIRLFKSIIRPVLISAEMIVVAIPGHRPIHTNSFSNVFRINKTTITEATKKGNLTINEINKIKQFFKEGSIGYYIEHGNKIAGYAFIQKQGIYQFGHKGQFNIPTRMMVLKNLYVLPEYRGKSLGKTLNEVRVSNIPQGYTPLGFVVKDNRYALRNLQEVGFQEIMIVRVVTYLRKWTKQYIVNVVNNNFVPPTLIAELIKGLDLKSF